MKRFLFLCFVAVGMMAAASANAQNYEEGDVVTDYTTFCLDQNHARTLKTYVQNENLDPYYRYLDKNGVRCYDTTRHRGVRVTRVRLLGLQWEVEVPAGTLSNGEEYDAYRVEVWRVKPTGGGDDGWIFLPIGVDEPEGTAL